MRTQVCDVKYGQRRGVFSEEAENMGDCTLWNGDLTEYGGKKGARAGNNWVWNQEKENESRG